MGLEKLASAGREITADNALHHLDGGVAQRAYGSRNQDELKKLA